jgi:Glyoxalase-like domain
MTVSVVGLSIDCADAAALAGFWSEAPGRSVNPGADAEHAKYGRHSGHPLLMTPQVRLLTGTGAARHAV